MGSLGRDETKHPSCQYEGNEDACSKSCDKCSIAIKTDGDAALLEENFNQAIKFYKKALFIDPKFAEAWNNLGNAYGMKSEYHNALRAFEKAIAVDPTYGKALYGKAITLRNLGKLGEAMTLANIILEMYDAMEIRHFKKELVAAGVVDTQYLIENKKAIITFDNVGFKIMKDNNLLNEEGEITIIESLYRPDEFVKSVLRYCKKKYASLGEEKTRGEYIITSFYGSICATIFHAKDNTIYEGYTVFEYLNEHIDVEFTDVNAERLLGTKSGEEKAERIWSIIAPYVQFSQTVFNDLTVLTDDVILAAMKKAYEIGMLTAFYYLAGKDKKHNKPTLPQFSSKKIEDYNSLEQIEIMDSKVPTNDLGIDAKVIAETENYYIYSCSHKGEYSRHIIRQSKNDLNEIVYLSYDHDGMCYFNGQLFYKTPAQWGGNDLYSVDVLSGKYLHYKWFSEKGYAKIDVVVGQDYINSVSVKNGKLIVSVSRKKSNFHLGENGKGEGDPFDLTMHYTLCVALDKGKYYLTRFYEDIDIDQLNIIYDTPRKNWHVGTALNRYYLIDNNRKAVKTPAGNVLGTSYIELAKSMANELEQYGENVPETSLLYFHMNMCDNIIQCPHTELEDNIKNCLKNASDWTYALGGDTSGWNRLFGSKISRKTEIDSWIAKITPMQMNAVLILGKKYGSINIAFVLALIVEKIPKNRQMQAFTKLADYVRNNTPYSINKNDFEVFASYYGIHFESEGTTINNEVICADIREILCF